MLRARRLAKPVFALGAAAVVVLALSACAFVIPGSFTVSQPGGIGSVRVHFAVCTSDEIITCGANDESGTLQYLAGIAVPPGAAAPATFTATPVGGGAPVTFTRNDEVASEMAAASAAVQKLAGEIESPEEIEEFEEFQVILGGPWPPSGLQGIGYLSDPVSEIKGQAVQWSVDADFGLPAAADGAPFAGPFPAAIAWGLRLVAPSAAANRPVHCIRIETGAVPQETDAFCAGSVQQGQANSADLRVGAPKKPVEAFVGGKGTLSFPLKFASTNTSVPTFSMSATTTAKGGKAKVGSGKFTPGALDPTTHRSPNGTGKVTVTLPKKVKAKTYNVTLTAKAPQGGIATAVGKLKVVKPKLKFGATKAGKGFATLKVKVPGAGKLTVSGKGVKKAKKKAKKKKTLKIKITPTGDARARLSQAGSVKLKVKVTFKPTSGISVTKKRSVLVK
jgi:hypothetical protein